MSKMKLTPTLLSGIHPIYGDVTCASFDGTEESAMCCASLDPNIIAYESAELGRWSIEVPTIAGEFVSLEPGDYVGLTDNDRVVPILAAEVE